MKQFPIINWSCEPVALAITGRLDARGLGSTELHPRSCTYSTLWRRNPRSYCALCDCIYTTIVVTTIPFMYDGTGAQRLNTVYNNARSDITSIIIYTTVVTTIPFMYDGIPVHKG